MARPIAHISYRHRTKRDAIEAAAQALARAEMTDYGQRVFAWYRDFSAAERQAYRAKARAVWDALT